MNIHPDPDPEPDWPPVRDAAAQIGAGTLPADTWARKALSRIASADAGVGAFVCTLDADAATHPSRPPGGALAGLPVAVKDIFDTRDLPTSYGSPIYAGAQPRVDAAVVSVLRRAGAIVVGKTTTTEFAFLQPTDTRNPRAPGRTPGGSSAGSAAAVAAGLVPLSIGTQTAGSVIRPASYCGVVGYKPSFGWLPTAGFKCFSWSLDTVGLFARNVPDMAWFAQALAGRALAFDDALDDVLGAACVVGVPMSYPWGELTPNARQALAEGCRALDAVGIATRACDLPPLSAAAFDAHAMIQGHEAWRTLGWEYEAHADALSPQLADYLRGARDITAAGYEAAQHIATSARAEVASGFNGFDLLLTPSAPDIAPPGLSSTGASTFNRLWTLLGLPCINVPGVLAEGGCPMGLQLIAPHGGDALLLRAAAVLEQTLRTPAR
jgi:Asp-tRNA(Asn)/Glu-tRNA(Gln) amidotransferase A subunit family amidase